MNINDKERKIPANNVASHIVDNERIITEKEYAEKSTQEKMKSFLHMNYEMLPHINAILSLTQKIKASDDIDEIKRSAKSLDASSRHLLTLYNNLLDQYFNNK